MQVLFELTNAIILFTVRSNFNLAVHKTNALTIVGSAVDEQTVGKFADPLLYAFGITDLIQHSIKV